MREYKSFIQFLKFGIVGISNTLLTALTIWFLLKVLHCSDYFSNLIGYIVGLINSFIWNRKWTFESKTNLGVTVFKFILTFAISYLFQLGNLYLLLHFTSIDPYFCQLLSIVVYTCINFVLNKYYTFKN
ncbi:MAG: GtrA family protein [Bacteroidota bacterium]|nr:GtrA family protein [Bacteroidota bacterium]